MRKKKATAAQRHNSSINRWNSIKKKKSKVMKIKMLHSLNNKNQRIKKSINNHAHLNAKSQLSNSFMISNSMQKLHGDVIIYFITFRL